MDNDVFQSFVITILKKVLKEAHVRDMNSGEIIQGLTAVIATYVVVTNGTHLLPQIAEDVHNDLATVQVHRVAGSA